METIVKGKSRKGVNKQECLQYPFDRKYPSMQEAAKAKTDWVVASKTPEEWEQLQKLMGK